MCWMRRVFLPLALAAFVLSPAAGAGSERTSHSCVRGGELRFYAADGTKLAGHRLRQGADGGHPRPPVRAATSATGCRTRAPGLASATSSSRSTSAATASRSPGPGPAANRFAADLAAPQGVREARQEEGLPRRRLDGRDRLARRGRERQAGRRRRRQHLGARTLPRLDAVARRRACGCPCSTSRPRGTTTPATTSRGRRDDARRHGSGRQAARDPARRAARDRARWPARPAHDARRSFLRAPWPEAAAAAPGECARADSAARNPPLRRRQWRRAGPPRAGATARFACGPGSLGEEPVCGRRRLAVLLPIAR